MTIKKTAISTSMALAIGLSFPLFAQTEGVPVNVVDSDAVTIECIQQAEADAMNPTDREKLTLPICEATEGAMDQDGTKAPTQ